MEASHALCLMLSLGQMLQAAHGTGRRRAAEGSPQVYVRARSDVVAGVVMGSGMECTSRQSLVVSMMPVILASSADTAFVSSPLICGPNSNWGVSRSCAVESEEISPIFPCLQEDFKHVHLPEFVGRDWASHFTLLDDIQA